MTRKSLYLKNTSTVNIFQSFTDLMSNAFMILSLLLLLVFLKSLQLNKNLQEANQRLQSATPIVIDEQSGKFKFTSGSAELNPDLKDYLQTQIIPTIKATITEKEIDFIQIIGHTDGQGISQVGNIDRNIEQVAQGKQKVTQLVPGSNTDLGLMRALAVVREIQQTSGLENVEFRAYSAGQLYLPNGELAEVNRDADASRRRIEIRFIPPGERQLSSE